MHVVDTRDGHRILADRFQPGVLKGAQFLADGGILAWAAGRPSLRRYDAAGTPVATVDMWGLKRAAMLPSGWIVIEPYLLELQLLDPRGGAPRHFVTGSQFLDLDQTADLRRVLALDGTGALWWIDDGDPPRVTYLTRRPGAYAAAVSADGATVAIVDQHAVEILDPITGAVRLRFEAEGQHLFDVALSPQGDRVAVGDGDRRARIWAVADGRLLAVLTGHEARVATVRFTADGGALVTASWDGTARVWGLGDLERPAAALRADIEAAWDLTLATAGRAPLR